MRHLKPDPTLQAVPNLADCSAVPNLADCFAIFTSAIRGGRLVPTKIHSFSFGHIENERIKVTIVEEKDELPPDKPTVPMDLTMALERGACLSQD